MLAAPLFFVACGSSSGGGNGGGGGGKTTSNDVFTCTVGSAAPKSPMGLLWSAPNKPGGSTTGSIAGSGSIVLYASGTSTISGKVEYEDRTFDSTGFTGTANLPVRYARVQVVENGNTVLKETTTAADGSYTLSSFAHGTGAITIRALTDSVSPYAATVKDNRDSSIYAVVSADLSSSLPATLSNQDLLADVNGAGPPFNIFDNLILGQERLREFAPATTLTQITANWWDGSITGSFYIGGGTYNIYLVGNSSDDDAYDDTVILHEMGHYVADIYSRDDSKGGAHILTGHYDLRLTWSEGWATFFGSLVRAVSGISSPEYYVDTRDASTLSFSYEIETLDLGSLSLSGSAKGADNEVAVSAVLWDIYDDSFPDWEWGSENLFMGYDEIWSIFDNDLPAASVATFETFWDMWEANVSTGLLTDIMGSSGGRDIRYFADDYEDDDTVGMAQSVAVGLNQQHTLFPAGDLDWFAISVTNGTTYTFTTGSLGDGADTLLTLYDTDGTTQVAQNDDDPSLSCSAPGSTTPCLASKIVCTAKVNRTVYGTVESYRPLVEFIDLDYDAASNPAAISNYGYYTLTITSP